MRASTRRPRVIQDTPWPSSLLHSWRAYYFESSLAPASRLSYSSTYQSYVRFCALHALPLDPTPNTLSLFVMFKSHTTRPSSVSSYLSAVVSQLEPHFPDLRVARASPLVRHTLAGIHRVHGTQVTRKQPLLQSDLCLLRDRLQDSLQYNNLLFLTQVDRKSVV